jgi:choline dehydrogenase-like flavoprotein
MYNRGQAVDYDDWAKLGNKGWDFKSLLPYFKKHEIFDDPALHATDYPYQAKYDASFHGTDGPIHTSFSIWRPDQEDQWIAASGEVEKRLGSPADGWSGDHIGTFTGLSTIDRTPGAAYGTRSYSTTGYLLPNAHRPNLHVLTEALVTKLSVSPDGSVTGVSFLHSSSTHNITVSKEVILSAGVVKSPQILELSGIGNPLILAKAGVECIVPNPRVGENLQDHPAIGIQYELADDESSVDALQVPAELEKAMAEYMTSKTGPLSSGGSGQCFASYSDLSTPEEIAAIQNSILSPDSLTTHTEKAKKLLAEGLGDPNDASLQLIMIGASMNIAELHSQPLLLKPPPEMDGKMGITLIIAVYRPLSVGSIHISSPDPEIDPVIDPKYGTHPADIALLSKGLELAQKVVQTSPFKEKLKKRVFPGEDVDLNTEEGRREYAGRWIGSEYHPVGNVSMGVEGQGAVDDRLRVWGTRGLRVIDASVVPLHVGGNIVSSVYAVAEKGADLVKEDWGL